MAEANKARYESDRANMQAIFTNAVAKVMTHNRATVSVIAGSINTVISGVNETTGEVAYTLTDAENIANASGKVVFDKGTNTDTVFYTGKQLPIYAAGETKWYVDEEGIITLEVAGVKYGEGAVTSGSDTGTEEETLAAGAYDSNGVMLASWEELVDDYHLDIETDYTFSNYETEAGSLYSVLNNNSKLTSTTKIIIDDEVTSIGDYAFSWCENLTSVDIGNGVTSVGIYSFWNCSKITSITIGDSLASIDEYGFSTLSSLAEITISENNTTYDSRDNSNCIMETATNTLVLGCNNTVIQNTVKNIGTYAFWQCNGLDNIQLPESVESIASYAFANCGQLTNITFTNSLKSIGDFAFSDCSNLTRIVIPESVISIGARILNSCSNLTEITISENNTVYDSRNNSNCIIETATNNLMQGCNNTVIPDTVVSIGDFAFYDCDEIESIKIPSSVTTISSSAFRSCGNLSTIYYSGTAAGASWGSSATVVAE